MKEKKTRNNKHLLRIRSLQCIITNGYEHCSGQPVVAHHLTHVLDKGGIGLKTGDNWTVPLCHAHHHSLHMIGEKSFWKVWGIDAEKEAKQLWERKNDR